MGMAGKKMGTDPEKLKKQMESGDMDAVLSGLSPTQRAQINGLLKNPQAVTELIASPKMQHLLKALMGK